jgi:7,8-dihydropterin-6-yl-methyl-4-(beta-D-ribofuranosyl)aminobenzene 5'-phosphate synthase
MIRLTIIVDNTAYRPDLQTEHGFACWIETGNARLLFDTGQGTALAPNAQALGIELTRANAIALSHGHYDHTGGLAEAWTTPETTPLYLHAGALAARYRVSGGTVKEISMPRPVRELLTQHMESVRYTNQPTEIVPGAWLTGFVPRHHHQEVAEPEPFFLDPSGQQPDHLVDDQALYLVTSTGVIVLLGCAHAGVINTLDHIRDLTGHAPLRAVIGGMHLRAASAERLAWTVAQLQRLNPGMLAPAHCTGDAAMKVLAEAFADRYQPCGAGATFDFVNQTETTT